MPSKPPYGIVVVVDLGNHGDSGRAATEGRDASSNCWVLVAVVVDLGTHGGSGRAATEARDSSSNYWVLVAVVVVNPSTSGLMVTVKPMMAEDCGRCSVLAASSSRPT